MPTNVICFGDSITHAAGFAEGDRWPTVLQQRLNDLNPGAYRVYNRGIGGHTAVQGGDRWQTDVAPLLPGILLIEFGYNDASVQDWTREPRVSIDQFKLKMREFYRVAKAADSRPVFIVNHPVGVCTAPQGNGKPYHENYAAYDAAIRELIAELGAECIDLPAMIEARGIAVNDFVAEDLIHLTPEANHQYADMVCTRLRELGAVAAP